jgi:hypothetical protein
MLPSRASLFVAFALIAGVASCPTGVIATPAQCNSTLAHYAEYAKWLQPLADRARERADENPIYESDVQYYAAELGDAQQCIRNLTPVLSTDQDQTSSQG